MKKKLNWFKVMALIMMIIEIIVVITANKELVRENITLWRLYIALIVCIFINFLFICVKRKGGK